jgi:hypothetical protein
MTKTRLKIILGINWQKSKWNDYYYVIHIRLFSEKAVIQKNLFKKNISYW